MQQPTVQSYKHRFGLRHYITVLSSYLLWFFEVPDKFPLCIHPVQLPEATTSSITDGIRHKYYAIKTKEDILNLNVVELSPNNPKFKVKIQASGNTKKQLESLQTICQKVQAIAGINAGYFNSDVKTAFSTHIQNGELLCYNAVKRFALGVKTDGTLKIGESPLSLKLALDNKTFNVDTLNEEFKSGSIAIYTSFWGQDMTDIPEEHTVFTVKNGVITSIENKKVTIENDYDFVVVLPSQLSDGVNLLEKSASIIKEFKPGWENVTDIISAGPHIIKNGQINISKKHQKFKYLALYLRSARTAIAIKHDNSVLFVTIIPELKNKFFNSTGPTLHQFADILKQLGATEALNLDGGRSSQFYLNNNYIDFADTPPRNLTSAILAVPCD